MYNKLFSKIVRSSIWLEPDGTRIVWFMFIALMDEDGFVQFASVANVAHTARIELGAAEEAIKILEGPDANSADPDNDGRRIEKVPGGWMVLNSAKYRDLVTRDMIRQQTRERVKRHRDRSKPVTQCNAPVTQRNGKVTPSDTDTDTDTKKKKIGTLARPTIEQVIELIGETAGRDFFDYYESNGWRVGRNPMKSWKSAAQRWKRNQHLVNPTRPSFGRPKERAPSYPKMSEPRECSDEERERVLKIAAEEKEKLRLQLTPNNSEN